MVKNKIIKISSSIFLILVLAFSIYGFYPHMLYSNPSLYYAERLGVFDEDIQKSNICEIYAGAEKVSIYNDVYKFANETINKDLLIKSCLN